MDKNWMDETYRFGDTYITGVKSFIQFAKDHLGRDYIRCPCVKCLNVEIRSLKEVEDHLIIKGISKTYKIWIYHGERSSNLGNNHMDEDVDFPVSDDEEGDEIQEMLEDVHRGSFFESSPLEFNSRDSENVNGGKEKSFADLLKEAERELYPNCTKFSTLSFLIKLLHIKVINRWSNKSFDMLLSLLKEAFPIGETLPKSHYESWRMLRGLGLGYVSIHACKNDCALFQKEYKDAQVCPICGESRWRINDGKGKRIPYKILRYFPLKPRLQRLFMSRKNANDMRWHKEKRASNDNILNHPADSIAWKEFDKEHPWFAEDPRNVRLGLASDGFNPFGNMHNSYSMWPVVLIPYNLPPWKCMKEQYFMMSLLIPGPRAPGKDIDVYLRPLVDELSELWTDGVQTYDASSHITFQMHAAVMWTINDFPAYGTLSGWSTKGYLACPSCNEETPSRKLRSKICYIGSRRFLDQNHRWRRSRQFDGFPEHRSKPKELTGDDVLRQLNHVNESTPGKHPANRKRKRTPTELNWTKKSIFFELPYWSSLKLRHNLDVMHIEKNICENVLGTLMNIEGKSKDTYKARLDLQDMNIRSELHLKQVGDKYQMPHACYTLSKVEQKSFCEFLKLVKFPDGYASNISRCANDADGKVSGLKSHDCHVLLQRLLPVGLRGYLPKNVSTSLVELGNFFKDLCCKSLEVDELQRLENDIVLILCKLEMIYPPAFFDVMVHLAIHLPREAMLGGPVQYRWMYFIERFLGTLKCYVRNRARPEGSIAEAYSVNETLTFCSMYLGGVETKFNKEERNHGDAAEYHGLEVFSRKVNLLGAHTLDFMSDNEREMCHWYILNNCEEVEPYLCEHMKEIEQETCSNLEQRQKEFPRWFEEKMKKLYSRKSVEATDQLYALACGPNVRARKYTCCIVNGVRFHTKDRDVRRRSQNSGLVVKGDHDENYIDFFGILTSIVELEYVKDNRVVLFECEWFETDKRKKACIQVDEYFTSINITKTWYKDDRYVLAIQANQVFYLNDTKLGKNWRVVQEFKHRHLYDPNLENEEIENDSVCGDDAYQEHVSSRHVGSIEINELGQLDRGDIEPENIDVRVNTNVNFEDADFVNYENDDDEDDTLIEYNDDEEDIVHSGDDDDDDDSMHQDEDDDDVYS